MTLSRNWVWEKSAELDGPSFTSATGLNGDGGSMATGPEGPRRLRETDGLYDGTRRRDVVSPYGAAMSRLIDEFEMLPGVGRKSAERLAHFILMCPAEKAMGLADAIRTVKTTVRPCAICYNLTEGEICHICSDSRRDQQVVC